MGWGGRADLGARFGPRHLGVGGVVGPGGGAGRVVLQAGPVAEGEEVPLERADVLRERRLPSDEP